jgi:hypothetical protein
VEGGYGADGTRWRNEETQKSLTGPEFKRSRAFSSSQSILQGGYKEVIAAEETGGVIAVVGVKKQFQLNDKRMIRWVFWAQHTTQKTIKQPATGNSQATATTSQPTTSAKPIMMWKVANVWQLQTSSFKPPRCFTGE